MPGPVEEPHGRIEFPRLETRLCRNQRAIRTGRGIRGQLDRTLQEGGRRRCAATSLSPARRPLELERDGLVRA